MFFYSEDVNQNQLYNTCSDFINHMKLLSRVDDEHFTSVSMLVCMMLVVSECALLPFGYVEGLFASALFAIFGSKYSSHIF